jgi:hypothetical protein
MTKSTNSVNGGAMPKVGPNSVILRDRRLGRPDHHGPGREGPASSLAGKTGRGGVDRPLGRPDRPAPVRWGNRPASLWIAEDYGCCASG